MVSKIDSFKQGEIILYKNYFPGNDKFLVILNSTKTNKDDLCVFCIATTTPKGPKQPPCNIIKGYFFIPIGNDFLDRETWLELDNIASTDVEEIVTGIESGKLITGEKQKLTDSTLKDLLNCINKMIDISEEYEDLIFSK